MNTPMENLSLLHSIQGRVCGVKRLIIFVFSSVMMYFQPDAFALRVDILSYPYPYKNPYLATATVAIMKGRDEFLSDDAVFRRSLEIKILENRDDIYLLEGMGTLRVRFYQQPRSAPLIFIIPGLGGSAYSGAVRYIAELLVDEKGCLKFLYSMDVFVKEMEAVTVERV